MHAWSAWLSKKLKAMIRHFCDQLEKELRKFALAYENLNRSGLRKRWNATAIEKEKSGKLLMYFSGIVAGLDFRREPLTQFWPDSHFKTGENLRE